MSHPTAHPIPEIPGVERLPEPEAGARRFMGRYWPDEIPLLVEHAKKLAHRSQYFIAPDNVEDGDDCYSIFKRRGR